MGKPEVGTPKYIANKIKAKGLQKLRWYCQMCQKQCRDENGFKCHTMSESHQRQLLLFADNQTTYLNQFSKEFSDGYLELLRRQFGTKRVPANRVYQEYISDRHHLHMNATQWETLTDFVKWLGREGKCVVDETEKGWFITYIDRDPETIKLQEAIFKKEKMDRDDHERNLRFLEKQIERGKKDVSKAAEHIPTDLNRKDDEKITINLSIKDNFKKPETLNTKESVLSKLNSSSSTSMKKKKDEKRKLSALEEIIKEEEERKKKKIIRDHWLTEDIVVKVKTDTLGEKYFNKKGIVEKVIDRYCAIVKMLDSNHKLKLDQAHLETVIPNIGRKVKVLNGVYNNMVGELVDINTDMYCVSVRITNGPLRGKIVDNLQYEHISKLHNV